MPDNQRTVRSNTIRSRPTAGARDLDSGTITRDPDVVGGYLEDAGHFPGGHAVAVARPRSESDVAAIVRHTGRLLAVGAQSSLTGGATPMGDTVMTTERLDQIVEVGDSTVTVQAGVPLRALQEELSSRGVFYPPVPTFDGAVAGGVVATNAAGASTFKYGSTRRWVRGLTVVLSDGSVLDIRRGEVHASADGQIDLVGHKSRRRIALPTYRMPNVPKCSAGYFAEPGMDLIDLFIGSEGTLGVVTTVTFALITRPSSCLLWLPMSDERTALDLVTAFRKEAQATWQTRDKRGVDIAAIEHLDRRSLEIIREDGADHTHGVAIPKDTVVGLLAQLELPADSVPTPADAHDQIAGAMSSDAPDTPLVRTCRILGQAGVLEQAELALPDDRRRHAQLLAFRESVPEGVNRRVREARRTFPGIHKTAADMIAPFERFEEVLATFRSAFGRRGLDYAIWGHISDGNVHPNVIPRNDEDVRRGHAAILECGRAVVAMGGSPLAEHGVGRSPTKQALLRDLYGEAGIEQMRRVKAVLDPEWRLAPGVLFPEPVRE